jgi:hypothetical protein
MVMADVEKSKHVMGFIKNALIGIAIVEAIKYLTRKDALGVSKIDEIREKAPEWLDKAKAVTKDIKAGQLPGV